MRARLTMSAFLVRVVLAWLAATVVALPAVAQSVAITGGKVFPVSGPPIDNATVLIIDGKITAVGSSVAVPAGTARIDARGHWVTPGLINASTRLGLVEIAMVDDTNDASAKGDRQVSAGFRSWEGLNPASVLWGPARNAGITSVVSLPGGGLIGGQAALVDTMDTGLPGLVRKAPVAMVANFGEPAAGGAHARGELFMRLRELFDDARVFAARREAFENAGTRAFAVGRVHLEALAAVLAGRMPLLASADRATDIEAALDLAAEYKFRVIIQGGAEAWQVADRLAKSGVPVLTGALDSIPASFASLGARQENAAILRKAGVPIVLIAEQGETFRARTLRQHAGNAVAYGLPWDDALRAVTLAPAEVFGVADSVGSLQAGRDGNVVVWDGDPFEFATRATHVLIRGRDARTASREDLLIERYKKRDAPRKP
jgi:imidazolonepropionase-like amidohydrolase